MVMRFVGMLVFGGKFWNLKGNFVSLYINST